MPVDEYSHADGCSVTGGYVYRGERVPDAVGRFSSATSAAGRCRASSSRTTRLVDVRNLAGSIELSAFGEDAAGELYAVSLDGRLYELVPETVPG